MLPISGNSIKLQLTKIVFLLCLILVKKKFTRKSAVRKDFFFKRLTFKVYSEVKQTQTNLLYPLYLHL